MNLIDNVVNWRVMDEPSLSDHRMIVFDVKGTLTTTTFTRNPGNIDWEIYIAVL